MGRNKEGTNMNMAENIIMIIILAWCALIMIVVGVFQLKSKEPVGFYTGEKPLKREQITDVELWNKKHGMMWIAYGVGMVLAYLVGIVIGNEVIFHVLFMSFVFGAIPVMIAYHHWLKKRYVK